MKLSQYIIQNNMTASKFAHIANLDHTTILRFIKGETKNLSGKTIAKIAKATNNEVTFNDFYDMEEAS